MTASSHVCLSCGIDQRRTRAIVEPHYGLPLVTCPSCGAHSVRRLHPILRRWRQFLRLAPSIVVLLLQLGAAFGAIVGLTALATVVGELDAQEWAHTFGRMGESRDFLVEVLFTLLAPPLAVGAWIGLVPHWRPRRALAVLVVLVFLGMLGTSLFEGVEWSNRHGIPFSIDAVLPDTIRRTIFMVPMFALTLPGVAIGAALARWIDRGLLYLGGRRLARHRRARTLPT